MPAPDNQSANWRFNSNGALANPDFLADDVARLSLSSDVSKPFAASSPDPGNTSVDSSQTEGQDAHSRNSSSGAGRLNIQADASSESTTSRSQPDRKEQPNYPSLSNGQRAPQKSHSGQANGRGRGAGFGTRTNQYRSAPQQIQVGMPGQGIIPSPTALGYPGAMSLGTPQQLYDMMGVIDPNAISRLQQSNIRGNHQHSGSDHDVNVQQSFNNAMFAPQLSAGLSMYSNQFFANQSQEAYRADLASQAQAMLAARLQQQYPPYPGSPPVTGSTDGAGIGSPSSSSGGNGPSANNRKLGLYKTELCRSWEEKHTCRYGTKCQFAHGEDELRNVSRHPKASHLCSGTLVMLIFCPGLVQDGDMQGVCLCLVWAITLETDRAHRPSGFLVLALMASDAALFIPNCHMAQTQTAPALLRVKPLRAVTKPLPKFRGLRATSVIMKLPSHCSPESPLARRRDRTRPPVLPLLLRVARPPTSLLHVLVRGLYVLIRSLSTVKLTRPKTNLLSLCSLTPMAVVSSLLRSLSRRCLLFQ